MESRPRESSAMLTVMGLPGQDDRGPREEGDVIAKGDPIEADLNRVRSPAVKELARDFWFSSFPPIGGPCRGDPIAFPPLGPVGDDPSKP